MGCTMMDIRIKELLDATQQKYGLDNYYLQSHEIYRDVTILGETNYFLSMEWFPAHMKERKGDYNRKELPSSRLTYNPATIKV